MRRIKLIAALSAVISSADIHAAGYSNTVFFGDSLSDAGTFKSQPIVASAAPEGGKFTTNPGPVWSEVLATDLGHPTAPANQGGTDYAEGGARVTQLPGYPNQLFIATATPIQNQIANYLTATGGRADSNAIYSVWAGANDVFALQNGDPAYNALPMTQVANNLAMQVGRLKAAGARYILVPNLPDIGTTPGTMADGPAAAAQATQLVKTYNSELYRALAAQGIRVIPIDTFNLLHQIMANPAQFGITNTTAAACTRAAPFDSSLFCQPTDYAPGSELTHVFADGVHPSTAAHQILADYVLGILSAPQQIAMMADSTISARSAWHDLLRAQMIGGENARKKTGRNVWISVQGETLDRDNMHTDPGTDESGYHFAIGMDFQIDPQFVAGAALSINRSNADFARDRGNYSQRDITLSAYGSWQNDPWFARGAVSYGDINYSTHRRVPLGISAYTANGDTDGRDLSAQIEGGYQFALGNFIHGPVLGLLAQDLRIDSFDEKNGGVIDLGYGTQRRHTLVGSAGWQFAYRAQNWMPYARIAVDRDFEDNQHSVDVSTLSVPEALPFSMPVEGPGRTRYSAQLGVNGTLLDAANFNIGIAQNFGQDDARDLQVFGGISLGF
jgi:outer membrane lipase/esterase